jgi:hypothetical protein
MGEQEEYCHHHTTDLSASEAVSRSSRLAVKLPGSLLNYYTVKVCLYARVFNGFCILANCNISSKIRNDDVIAQGCVPRVGLYYELRGRCELRLFSEVDCRCRGDFPRGKF